MFADVGAGYEPTAEKIQVRSSSRILVRSKWCRILDLDLPSYSSERASSFMPYKHCPSCLRPFRTSWRCIPSCRPIAWGTSPLRSWSSRCRERSTGEKHTAAHQSLSANGVRSTCGGKTEATTFSILLSEDKVPRTSG